MKKQTDYTRDVVRWTEHRRKADKVGHLLSKRYFGQAWSVGYALVKYVQLDNQRALSLENAPLALVYDTEADTATVYLHTNVNKLHTDEAFKPIPRHPPVVIDCKGLGHIAICNRIEKAWLELVNIERTSGVESLAEA